MTDYPTPFECRPTAAFQKVLADLISRFPKSRNSIEVDIKGVYANPFQGDAFPGFGAAYQVRKARFALKAYREGKRYGLRFIFMVQVEKRVVVPLHIYKKGDYRHEHQVKDAVLANLKAILQDLSG